MWHAATNHPSDDAMLRSGHHCDDERHGRVLRLDSRVARDALAAMRSGAAAANHLQQQQPAQGDRHSSCGLTESLSSVAAWPRFEVAMPRSWERLHAPLEKSSSSEANQLWLLESLSIAARHDDLKAAFTRQGEAHERDLAALRLELQQERQADSAQRTSDATSASESAELTRQLSEKLLTLELRAQTADNQRDELREQHQTMAEALKIAQTQLDELVQRESAHNEQRQTVELLQRDLQAVQTGSEAAQLQIQSLQAELESSKSSFETLQETTRAEWSAISHRQDGMANEWREKWLRQFADFKNQFEARMTATIEAPQAEAPAAAPVVLAVTRPVVESILPVEDHRRPPAPAHVALVAPVSSSPPRDDSLPTAEAKDPVEIEGTADAPIPTLSPIQLDSTMSDLRSCARQREDEEEQEAPPTKIRSPSPIVDGVDADSASADEPQSAIIRHSNKRQKIKKPLKSVMMEREEEESKHSDLHSKDQSEAPAPMEIDAVVTPPAELTPELAAQVFDILLTRAKADHEYQLDQLRMLIGDDHSVSTATIEWLSSIRDAGGWPVVMHATANTSIMRYLHSIGVDLTLKSTGATDTFPIGSSALHVAMSRRCVTSLVFLLAEVNVSATYFCHKNAAGDTAVDMMLESFKKTPPSSNIKKQLKEATTEWNRRHEAEVIEEENQQAEEQAKKKAEQSARRRAAHAAKVATPSSDKRKDRSGDDTVSPDTTLSSDSVSSGRKRQKTQSTSSIESPLPMSGRLQLSDLTSKPSAFTRPTVSVVMMSHEAAPGGQRISVVVGEPATEMKIEELTHHTRYAQAMVESQLGSAVVAVAPAAPAVPEVKVKMKSELGEAPPIAPRAPTKSKAKTKAAAPISVDEFDIESILGPPPKSTGKRKARPVSTTRVTSPHKMTSTPPQIIAQADQPKALRCDPTPIKPVAQKPVVANQPRPRLFGSPDEEVELFVVSSPVASVPAPVPTKAEESDGSDRPKSRRGQTASQRPRAISRRTRAITPPPPQVEEGPADDPFAF